MNTNNAPMPIEDAQDRRAALNPRESFIVQAPAGSGKTELLVRRYLALLGVVKRPEQILAITFTRKATAEMRARIIRALNREGESDDEVEKLIEGALKNDQKHNWKLTENPRRLRVQTIDAFCNELVWRMPWSTRFGAPPDVLEDAREQYQLAAKQTLDQVEEDSDWGRACASLLHLLDADWHKAQTLLADMLAKRDKWVRLVAGDHARDNTASVEEMWQKHIDEQLVEIAEVLSDYQSELCALGKFAAHTLLDGDERYRDSPIVTLHKVEHFPKNDWHCIDQWRAIGALLLTGAGNVRATVNIAIGFPPGTDEKERMLALLEKLREQTVDAAEMLRQLKKIKLLPSGQFNAGQRESIVALMTLLPLAAAQLSLVFGAQNRADYIELTQRAVDALGELDAPSDLALAFDYQLTHLLMDEFQDTSNAHIDLLVKLTAGWQRGDGRTVFLVGDPMQSIYRFREAEVGNFLRVKADGLSDDIRPQFISLTTNFRSQQNLVDWFNDTFEQVMPPRDDAAIGAIQYNPAVARADAQGGLHFFHRLNNVADAPKRVAQCVAEVHAEYARNANQQTAGKTIAVLGRTRSALYPIADALRQLGVKFQAVELQPLADRAAIGDLLALTRAIADATDRIAWLSILRAPWCGLTLAELCILCEDDAANKNQNAGASVAEQCRNARALKQLPSPTRARVAKLMDCMDAAFARRGRIAMRANVEATWLALDAPATIDGAHDLDNCARYLDLIGNLEQTRGAPSAADISDAVDHLWAAPGDEADIQLLTIHKAKGLEFDAVFLPALEKGTRSESRALLRWQQPHLDRLLLAPLPASDNADDAFYNYLTELDKAQNKNEARRLLYVACTRAEQQLHLFGVVKENDDALTAPSGSLLELLPQEVLCVDVDVDVDEDNEDAADSRTQSGDESPSPRLRRLADDWSPPPLPPGIAFAAAPSAREDEMLEFSWAGHGARIVGIVLHHIFEHAADDWRAFCETAPSDEQIAHWQNLLRQHGAAESELADAQAHLLLAVNNARTDPKAAWIFDNTHRDIKTEWALTGIYQGAPTHIIIDRTFVDQHGVRWIIDFKSSRHEGGDLQTFLATEQQRHENQMQKYAAIVAHLSEAPIRLGLYFPAVCGWREWAGAA